MISLLQLQYFQVLALEGSMTRASRKLYISQTTLSAMIAKLETEVGVQLFDRRNNRLYLNEYGNAYLKHINIALSEITQAERELAEISSALHSHLSLAMTSPYVWQEVLLNFLSRYPKYHIDQHSDTVSQFAEKLVTGKLDFVLTGYDDLNDERLERRTLLTIGICLCVLPSHPLANRADVFLKELENEPIISLSHELSFQHFLENIFFKAGITPKSIVECSYLMRPQLTGKGFGIAITSDAAVCHNLFPGHIFIPIRDEFAKRKIALFWLKGRQFNHAMKDFRNFLYQYNKLDSTWPISIEEMF